MIQNLRNNQNQGAPLAVVDQAQLKSLSQQGNMSYEQMVEQQGAQRAMMNALESSEENLEIPKVNFYPSRHHDPKKARKKDIRQAYKLLRPSKRSRLDPRRLFGSRYRYNNNAATCVVDGCDCEKLIRIDNLYDKISDEHSGRSLWEMYWKNPVTGEAQAFVARDRVTGGRNLQGTYCPEHLHLYHLLTKWETEQEKEREENPKRIRDRIRQGVSTVVVPIRTKKKEPVPAMLDKYEPFFEMLTLDAKKSSGIHIAHYLNPVTGINDLTTVTFDLRVFQRELELMEEQRMAALEAQQHGFTAVPAQQAPPNLAMMPGLSPNEDSLTE